MENAYRRYRPILIPIAILLVGFAAILVLASNYWGRLKKINQSVAGERQQISILEDRLGKLREASAGVSVYSQNALLAIPVDNSALAVVSQLRRAAQEQNLSVEDLAIEGLHESEDKTLSRLDLSFVVRGRYQEISVFLVRLGQLLPLINVSSVDMSSNNEAVSARVVVSSFWAPLPEKIPALTEAITELSQDELATLNTLSSFQKPLGVGASPEGTIQTPSKSDPFSF